MQTIGAAILTERFLRNCSVTRLDPEERERLESAIFEVRTVDARKTVTYAGDPLSSSMLLVEGFMSRHIDDRNGLRQLVAIHVPGDFVDLHGFPLKVLDHDVATMTAATIAVVPHSELAAIERDEPILARKLWTATLMDAAVHRAWLFRVGRLDGIGRVAHFFCEMNARLHSAGLSDGHRYALGLTQGDVAEICGLTNVHVNRVMRTLREDGLCYFRSSFVEIPQPDRLAARGQFDPRYLYRDRSWLQSDAAD